MFSLPSSSLINDCEGNYKNFHHYSICKSKLNEVVHDNSQIKKKARRCKEKLDEETEKLEIITKMKDKRLIVKAKEILDMQSELAPTTKEVDQSLKSSIRTLQS